MFVLADVIDAVDVASVVVVAVQRVVVADCDVFMLH